MQFQNNGQSMQVYSIFLLLLVIIGCVTKPGPKTNVQNQQPIQNSTTTPSMIVQTDSVVVDSADRGINTRKLIRRGNVEQLTTQPGKMVVFVCIDQTGKVTSATFDPDASSNSHARFARQAEECAKQYVFEEDMTAPIEQCGKLTFMIKRQ